MKHDIRESRMPGLIQVCFIAVFAAGGGLIGSGLHYTVNMCDIAADTYARDVSLCERSGFQVIVEPHKSCQTLTVKECAKFSPTSEVQS